MKQKNVSDGKKQQSQPQRPPADEPTETKPSPASDGDNTERNSRNPSTEIPPAQPSFWKTPNHWVAVATVVIAVANGLYTFFALRQWTEMQTANQINREALIAVQRAFVIYQGTDGGQAIQRSQTGKIEMISIFGGRLLNTGSTPARGIAQAFSGDFLPDEPTEDLFLKHRPSRGYVFGPKDPTTFGRLIKPMDSIVTGSLKDALKAPTQTMGNALYIWGWVSYKDVFADTPIHLTEFCQKMVSVFGTQSSPNTPLSFQFSFVSCLRHNCSDKDCTNYQKIIEINPSN